jgi:hypothetical protein
MKTRGRFLLGLLALVVLAQSCGDEVKKKRNNDDDDDGGQGAAGGTGGGSGGDCGATDTLENCGECGVECAPANASGATCATGVCQYTSCIAPFDDCDGDADNGCEADLSSDPLHCSACNAGCDQLLNVSNPLCVESSCTYQDCDAGFGDCDADVGNGCEQSLDTLIHCGGCDTPCAPANATGATCAAGTCDFTSCTGAFADCDSNPQNGCEADTDTDEQHCGGCNSPCDPGESCGSGTCGGCLNGDPVVNGFCQPQAVCNLAPAQIFCGGNCSNNHTQYANWWCQLAGYSSAATYTVLTSGTVQCYYYNGGAPAVLSMCSQVMGPTSYGLASTCDAVTNLLCVP